jgi:hypothetical protein
MWMSITAPLSAALVPKENVLSVAGVVRLNNRARCSLLSVVVLF